MIIKRIHNVLPRNVFLWFRHCEVSVKLTTKNLVSRESYTKLVRERRREQARENNDCILFTNGNYMRYTLIG